MRNSVVWWELDMGDRNFRNIDKIPIGSGEHRKAQDFQRIPDSIASTWLTLIASIFSWKRGICASLAELEAGDGGGDCADILIRSIMTSLILVYQYSN
jgi:hypothetical protein